MTEHTCTKHTPGTYSCRAKHGCPCEPCVTAARRHVKLDAYRRATGVRNRIEADPIREHVEQLVASGMGRAEVARRADVEIVTVSRLLAGQYRELRRDRGERLLGVKAAPIETQTVGLVAACGLTRRLEALAISGWSIMRVLDLAGVHRSTYARAKRTGRCYAASRAAVAAVYDDLWDERPQATNGTRWVTERAYRSGCLPALAWDDGYGQHGIDNPAATPYDCAWDGRRTYGSLLDVIADAAHLGRTATETAAGLGIKRDTVYATCRRYDELDLWERLTRQEAS